MNKDSTQEVNDRNQINECYRCIHKREIPGNCHIKCNNPDPEMTGEETGIKGGWFRYPGCFDPVWKGKLCANFEAK